MHPRYRPDIDGLRALAVMAVILFHAFPKVVPGGFVGVDIFFVISGYLITQIIQGDLENGRFNAGQFYARRIRRIFPALIIVLIVAFALGWRFLAPAEFTSLGKNIFASALFSANLMLLSETGYFDISAHLKPLLHLGSLGIEEQFYLVWPLTLWLIPRRWLTVSLLVMLVGSFALNLFLIGDHPAATFYLPFTRAWELIAGGLLLKIPKSVRQANEITGFCGLAAIVCALFLFTDHIAFPGWAAALPVAGAALLMISEESAVNRVVLGNRAAINVGLISYPLYLWHWPLLVFAEIARFRPLTDVQRGLVIATTFLLAWLTYSFAEKRIRFGVYKNRSLGPLSIALGSLACIGAITVWLEGFPLRIPEIIREAAQITTSPEGLRFGQCLLNGSPNPEFSPNCVDDSGKGILFVWGDSTAAVLAEGLNQIKDQTGYRLAQMTVNSCPPVLVSLASLPKFCVESNQAILSQIARLRPDTVLLHGAWDGQYTAEVLRPTINALRALGIPRIVLVGPSPQWSTSLPSAVADYYQRMHELIPMRTTLYMYPQAADVIVRTAARELNVEYFSAKDAMCNEQGCLTRSGPLSRDITTSDFIHLTPNGSRILALAVAADLAR
jgi:peptidoglycan/LPS O-acetylase OafA/YrhL